MAFGVYQRCAGQLIFSGMGGPVDINILAVMGLMALEEVPHQAECLEKVQLLARIIIREQDKERARLSEQDAKKRGGR